MMYSSATVGRVPPGPLVIRAGGKWIPGRDLEGSAEDVIATRRVQRVRRNRRMTDDHRAWDTCR